MLAGTIPRNVLFAANLRYGAGVPWAVPVVAIYLWGFWRYLGGAGPPALLPRNSVPQPSRPPRRPPRVGMGAHRRRPRHRLAGAGAARGESAGGTASPAPARSLQRSHHHRVVASSDGGAGRRIDRGSGVPRLHARPPRATCGSCRSHPDHGDGVRGGAPGLHAGAVAVLRRCGRALRHGDVAHELGVACRGAPHRGESPLEPRPAAARSGRVAGPGRRDATGVDDRR